MTPRAGKCIGCIGCIERCIAALFGCERRCEGSLVGVYEVGGVVMMYLEAMAPIYNSY